MTIQRMYPYNFITLVIIPPEEISLLLGQDGTVFFINFANLFGHNLIFMN